MGLKENNDKLRIYSVITPYEAPANAFSHGQPDPHPRRQMTWRGSWSCWGFGQSPCWDPKAWDVNEKVASVVSKVPSAPAICDSQTAKKPKRLSLLGI